MMPLPSISTAILIVGLIVGLIIFVRCLYVSYCCRRKYRKVDIDPLGMTPDTLPGCSSFSTTTPLIYLQLEDDVTRQCERILYEYRKKRGKLTQEK